MTAVGNVGPEWIAGFAEGPIYAQKFNHIIQNLYIFASKKMYQLEGNTNWWLMLSCPLALLLLVGIFFESGITWSAHSRIKPGSRWVDGNSPCFYHVLRWFSSNVYSVGTFLVTINSLWKMLAYLHVNICSIFTTLHSLDSLPTYGSFSWKGHI